MPRNAQGVYSLPAGNPVIPGTLIESTWANPTMDDIGAALTGSLPRNGSAPMTGPLILAGNATVPLEAVPLQQMELALGSNNSFLPAGTVQLFAFSAVPSGWLECNGAAISRTTYANLFNVIGTTYGAGDGNITFNVPDLRGQFVRGWDHARGVDPGRALGSQQAPANQAHTHTPTVTNPSHAHSVSDPGHAHSVSDPGHSHSIGGWRSTSDTAQPPSPYLTSAVPGNTAAAVTGIGIYNALTGVGVAAATQNTSVAIAQEGTEARPTNVAMVYCIKAFGAVQTDGLGSMAFQNKETVNILGGSGVFDSLQCTKVPTLPNDVARLSDIGNQLADIFSSDPAVLLVDKTNPTNPILRPQTNIPNGMVKLDAAGFVPSSVLNVTDLTFLGTWDASSGLLPTGTFVTGDYYGIDVAGTLTLETSSGSQAVACNVGDSIIYKTTPIAGWWHMPAAVASALPATAISFAPAGTIVATNVQAAIEEVSQDVTDLELVVGDPVQQTLPVGSAVIPAGTQAERDAAPSLGFFRYNLTANVFEGFSNNGWGQVGGGQMYGNAAVKGIFYNAQVIAENITVLAGQNGLSAGPVTVDNGFTVTVEAGSTWSVV